MADVATGSVMVRQDLMQSNRLIVSQRVAQAGSYYGARIFQGSGGWNDVRLVHVNTATYAAVPKLRAKVYCCRAQALLYMLLLRISHVFVDTVVINRILFVISFFSVYP